MGGFWCTIKRTNVCVTGILNVEEIKGKGIEKLLNERQENKNKNELPNDGENMDIQTQ